MIGAIFKELIGLFVDDELLAAAILCAVALITALALTGLTPSWLVGLLLAVILPAALTVSVLRGVRRGTPKPIEARRWGARKGREGAWLVGSSTFPRRCRMMSQRTRPGFGPKIEYVDHQQSLPQILPFFPGLKKNDLPEGQGWAVERVSAIDAQRHPSRRALALSSDNE